MPIENVIITGNQAANNNQYAGVGTGAGSLFNQKDIQYGRVTSINPDRSIQYEPITNTLNASKLNYKEAQTSIAYNFNPNFTRLPEVGELVPLITGPNNQIGNTARQFDKITYYLIGPISIQNTVDDNKVPQNPPPKQENSVKDYKANDIGINNQPGGPRPKRNPLPGSKPVKNYVITRPLPNSNNFAVIYGGMPSATNGALKMQKLINDLGLSSWRNWIFTDYENSLDSLISAAKEKYKLNDISISSICGWSRGGQEVWGMIGKFGAGKPFIGLMDPTTISTSYNTSDPNVRMMYRTENWPPKLYPTINKLLPIMAERLGKKAEYISTPNGNKSNNHSLIPKLFLQKYKNEL